MDIGTAAYVADIVGPVAQVAVDIVGTAARPGIFLILIRFRINRFLAVRQIDGTPPLRKIPSCRPIAACVFNLRKIGISPRRCEIDGIEHPLIQRRRDVRHHDLRPLAELRRGGRIDIVAVLHVYLQLRVLAKLQVHRLETHHCIRAERKRRAVANLDRPQLVNPHGRRIEGYDTAANGLQFGHSIHLQAVHFDIARHRRIKSVLRVVYDRTLRTDKKSFSIGTRTGNITAPSTKDDTIKKVYVLLITGIILISSDTANAKIETGEVEIICERLV